MESSESASKSRTSASFAVRLRELATSRRGRIILVGGACALLAAAVGGVAYLRYFAPEGGSTTGVNSLLPSLTIDQGPKTTPALLDGTGVTEELANRRPLAVMVENHPDARPQAGFADASVVFEAIVEGGITRFMAVYGPREAKKIGPVRSARPAYVAYAAGFKALYAHAGGSQGGLAAINSTKEIVDLPHTNGYFQREPQAGIASEHTLFTSTEQLYRLAGDKDAKLTADITPWKFVDDPALEKRGGEATVSINFSTNTYTAEWTYDRTENTYLRSMAGAAHVDRLTGDRLSAKNVVAITVARQHNANTNQGKGEWTMTTEGSGKALLFQNGQVTEGKWKKDAAGNMLRFYDANDNEVSMIRGRTWIEVVPPEISVNHSEKAYETPTTEATSEQ